MLLMKFTLHTLISNYHIKSELGMDVNEKYVRIFLNTVDRMNNIQLCIVFPIVMHSSQIFCIELHN